LPDGSYAAYASQESSIGNPTGTSAWQSFTISTASPEVTLSQPTSPSKDTTPSFTGTASDTTEVLVRIYAGSSAKGTVVASASATGSGGNWSSGGATPPLTSGQYTAQATQKSSLKNPDGVSDPRTFTIDTSSPHVTLDAPPARFNDTTPSFTGKASDTTEVVVWIYPGPSATGSPVASATAGGTGGSWSSSGASPALADGQYTAVARQESSLGNPDGVSESRTFRIDTAPPTVTLNAPPARTNDTTPSFTGTASDTTQVVVQVYAGVGTGGSVVAKAFASGGGGGWSSGGTTPALNDGTYTAVATQKSSLLGNPEGASGQRTFTVETSPPKVTLTPPAAISNNTTPSFTGTASDTTPVTVQIYAGTDVSKPAVAKATATGTGGGWASGNASPPLPSGKYTAVATQKSSLLGNPDGKSEQRTFTVDTSSPKVTLAPPPARSNNTTPAFSGTGSDTGEVTVQIYAGVGTGGPIVAKAFAAGTGGSWTSGYASPALVTGKYTAVAAQKSTLGNPDGKSEQRTFEVDTGPPKVTLNAPTARSKQTTPSFKGTASDSPPVSVQIYAGEGAKGPVVATATATVTAGSWTSGNASPPLVSGKYTAVAVQKSSLLGNPEGSSEPRIFEVDTAAPTVTVTPPATPSANASPSLSGTASEPNEVVVVKLYAGKSTSASWTETVKPVKKEWTTKPVSPPLANNIYKAIATQESTIGNGPGTSAPVSFVVDSEAPTVTLAAPRPRLNEATPSFRGTATNTTPVNVKIYAGLSPNVATDPVLAQASAGGTGGAWTSGAASPALPDGPYTAVASQANLDKKHEGGSEQRHFVVDTVAPQVALTYPADGASAGPGSQLVEGVAGTEIGDTPSVTVRLFGADGVTNLQTIAVNALAGRWSVTFGGLGAGLYSVRAEQADDAGNLQATAPRTFSLVEPVVAPQRPTLPPAASLAWFPVTPHTGEPVSLVSSSTDAGSPITSFAWDLAGNGAFVPGGQVLKTTFSTPGGHTVRLRVADANGLASMASATIGVTSPPAPLMQPYPIVRFLTSRTASGIRLRQLTVQAPAGARIVIGCKSRACPVKPQSLSVRAGTRGALEFKRFQRSLRVGVILEIRVSQPGLIGKYTRLTVRRGKPPSRFDSCLSPNAKIPIACPSS
jgi:hypothetical protein